MLTVVVMSLYATLTFANNAAVVVRSSGEVLRIDTNNQTMQLNRRDTLTEGDIIQTGDNAYATLKFADLSLIDIGENTKLKIAQYRPQSAENQPKFLLELLSGRLRTITGKLAKEPDAFELRTQHASIGIRGTEFEVIQVGSNETQVFRYTGEVIVRSLAFFDSPLTLDETNSAASVVAGSKAIYLTNTTQSKMGPFSNDLITIANAIPAPLVTPAAPFVLPLAADGNVPLSLPEETPEGPLEAFVRSVTLQQWSDARALADELLDRFEGLPRFDLYYGLLLAQERAFDEAIFAFERVLLYQPEQHRARLELGRAYFMQRNYIRAQDALEQVLAAKPPSNVAKAVRRLLAQNESAMRRAQSRTELGGKVLFGRNTNANLGSDVKDGDLDANLLGLTRLADTAKPIDSDYVQWSIYTGLTQPTSQYSQNHFRLDFTNKNFLETNVADVSSLTGIANFHFQNDRRRYLLPLSTKLNWRDGQLWGNTTHLSVSPQYRVVGPLWAGVSLETDIDFSFDEDEKTSIEDAVGLTLFAMEHRRRHYFSSQYRQRRLAGEDDEHLEWRGLANAYQLNWPLPLQLSALLSFEHQWRHYNADDLFFTVNSNSTKMKRRQDQVIDSLFNASWSPTDWMQNSLIVEWHQIDSNINAYSHAQWLISSAIHIHF